MGGDPVRTWHDPPGYPLGMQTIPFARPPAWVTIGEAFGLAWRYWRASWERWVLAVVAVALADGLTTWLIGNTLLDQPSLTRLLLQGDMDPTIAPRLLAGPFAVAVVSLVADWFLYANAIVGLRGRPMTLGWVVGSGLRVLLALLVLSLLLMLVFVPLALLGPLALLAALAGFPVLVYVSLRLQFWVLGVFDGQGIQDALRQSWAITRGAVLRVLGWVLALAGLSLLIEVGLAFSTGLLRTFPGPVAGIAAGIASLVLAAFQAFSVILLAILYESQRGRFEAMRTSPYGGYGSPYGGTGSPPPADPDAPPPPPPTDPWHPWRS
jgi:hypothetical protein